MPNKIEYIFIHASDSRFGTANVIRGWHLQNGWSDVGYHYVIQNGFPTDTKNFFPFLDGAIEPGRLFRRNDTIESDEVGSHVFGFNQNSIGICLIGTTQFTVKQAQSLKSVVADLLMLTHLTYDQVLGHYEVNKVTTNPKFKTTKTCPNIDMDLLRGYLSGKLTVDKIPNVR